MNKRFEKIGNYVVDFDSMYYVSYAGGKRDLPKKDMKDYQRALSLPELAQRRELRDLGPDKNPNVFPIKGKVLMELIRDKKLVPMFDFFFEKTHMLMINDLIVFESMKAKSYEIALRG